MTAVRVPAATRQDLERILGDTAPTASLNTVAADKKQTYAVVVSLRADEPHVRTALKNARGEEVELPRLHTSATEALGSARSRIGELHGQRQWQRRAYEGRLVVAQNQANLRLSDDFLADHRDAGGSSIAGFIYSDGGDSVWADGERYGWRCRFAQPGRL